MAELSWIFHEILFIVKVPSNFIHEILSMILDRGNGIENTFQFNHTPQFVARKPLSPSTC